jgi:hypothetical protein
MVEAVEVHFSFFGFSISLYWQKNSKFKVEKAFLFMFTSTYAEMSFWGPKSLKCHKIGSKTSNMGMKKSGILKGH